MKKMFFVLIFMGLRAAFASGLTDDSYDRVMSVIHGYSETIKKEKNIALRCYGLDYSGEDNVYDGKVHLIDLGYSLDARLHYKEARKIFYIVVDDLLKKINSTESLRKYFFHYPVGYEDLYFRLSFDYDDEGFLRKGEVESINILDNEIMYFFINDEHYVEKTQLNPVSPGVYLQHNNPLEKLRDITRKLPEGPEAEQEPNDVSK